MLGRLLLYIGVVAGGLLVRDRHAYLRQCLQVSLLEVLVGLLVKLHEVGKHAAEGVAQAQQREELVLLCLIVQDLAFALPANACGQAVELSSNTSSQFYLKKKTRTMQHYGTQAIKKQQATETKECIEFFFS